MSFFIESSPKTHLTISIYAFIAGSTLIFNLVNLYNQAFIDTEQRPVWFPDNDTFGPDLSDTVCRDAIDIHSLLYNYNMLGRQTDVPDSGLDADRYDNAKSYINQMIPAQGSSHKNHSCGACCQIDEANQNKSECFYLSLHFLFLFVFSDVQQYSLLLFFTLS